MKLMNFSCPFVFSRQLRREIKPDYRATQTTGPTVIHLRGHRFVTLLLSLPLSSHSFFLSKGSAGFVAQGEPKGGPSLFSHRCQSNLPFFSGF